MRNGAVRVLIVDDDPVCALSLARVLERRGYLTAVASDAAAALELIVADPRGYDVLLTDYDMPGLKGHELIAEARLLAPGLPALICSGSSVPPDVAPRVPVLLKPVLADLLARLVAALSAHREDVDLDLLRACGAA